MYNFLFAADEENCGSNVGNLVKFATKYADLDAVFLNDECDLERLLDFVGFQISTRSSLEENLDFDFKYDLTSKATSMTR